MKKIFSIIVFLCATAVFSQSVGSVLEFSGEDFSGNNVGSELFSKNKITMINVWGTFCGPCIREMPDLARISESHKNSGVEVVGVVIDVTDRKGNVNVRQKANAEKIVSQTGADYKHIVPSQKMISSVLKNVQAVPTTFFVDSTGKVIHSVIGARDEKEWQKLIQSLLTSKTK